MNFMICKVCGKIGLDQLDFRMFYHAQNGRYYYRVMCKICSKGKLNTGSKGRPTGHAMSNASKTKITNTRTGYEHTPETKDKISASLLEYFDKLHPLSDEMLRYYTRIGVDDVALKFLVNNKEEIDNFDDVKTERKLRGMQYYECELFDMWTNSCSDTITP